ncbi:MAG: deoxyribodipyrimidine photo-lyase, partial [Myxococcota bacterium]
MPRALVWFRDDLRLDDHLALEAALAACPEGTVLLHVFDPRVWAPARGLGLELPRLGARRALFWRQAVASLRVEVRSRGGELVVRVGDPAEVVPEVASSVGAEAVFAQAHVTHDEVRDEGRVREALAASSRRLVLTPGRTLVHIRDLPFALEELPDVFTPFRKKVE